MDVSRSEQQRQQRLEGKRVLLSAAGQGIGRASALAMAKEGAKVFATDINVEALDHLKSDDSTGNIETLVMDVRSKEDMCVAVERAKPDVLFNCAGFVHNGKILDCTEEDWDSAFNINCRSMFHLMQLTIPGMIQRGKGGSIINMSSVCSSVSGLSDRFVYTATKAAVIGMTKSVAKDYINNGIRCNCICPGTVDTPSLHDRFNNTGSHDAAYEIFSARIPMGRFGKPNEIAALVVYLASDESAYTTGQEHIIDGGLTL